jgi:hypothetical protein
MDGQKQPLSATLRKRPYADVSATTGSAVDTTVSISATFVIAA